MIHRLGQKPAFAGKKHGPVRFHNSYRDQREEYLRYQGGPHQDRPTHGRGHVALRTITRPVEVNPMSPEEMRRRLLEARGAEAAQFVQRRNTHESQALTVIEQYNNVVKHFLENGHSWPKDDCDIHLLYRIPKLKTFERVVGFLLDTPMRKQGSRRDHG